MVSGTRDGALKMINPIFAQTQHHYDSYTDYWRLVELADYPICAVGELDPDSDNIYIITPVNGEWSNGWENPKAKIVAWLLEWYDECPQIPGVSEYWTSDRWYAQQLGVRYVPFGSHPKLVEATYTPARAKWDVALLAYLAPQRRSAVITQLKELGLSVAPNGWGDVRNDVLAHSKMMLHIHQHTRFPCVPVQRFALAACAGLPLLSERMHDAYPMQDADFESAAYSALAQRAKDLLNNAAFRGTATALSKRLCFEFNFGANVKRTLEGKI
jgi:hypothetical protein